MSDWVDLQVSHHLAEVKAPAELWQHINFPAPRRRRTIPRLALATAVVVVIAVAYSSTRPQAIPRPSALNAGSCTLCHM
jgi:hypothetical protein